MIILKIALGILVVGIVEFFALFLWCMFIDWKHAREDKGKSEV